MIVLTLLLTLLLTVGCEAPNVVTAPGPAAWIESRRVADGAPVILHAPPGTALPEVEGLVAKPIPPGDGTWELRGKAGSYIVDVPVERGEPVKLFFDIGVEGPTGGPMDDLATIPPPPPSVWPAVLASAVGLGLAAGGGALLWRRLRPVPPPPPPEAPDRLARRQWAALRARTDLAPEALALALSGVYRAYLDAVQSWPATSRTTREILDNLAGELSALQLERARRLLSAMDLVKFSDRGAHASLFEALDADFDALVQPRRPRFADDGVRA